MRDQFLKESVQRVLEEDQKQVVLSLNGVLAQHKDDVLQILTTNYGLGSEEPSPFSLQMVERLQLREACDHLMKSEDYQQKMSSFTKSDPARTSKVIDELGCRSNAH